MCSFLPAFWTKMLFATDRDFQLQKASKSSTQIPRVVGVESSLSVGVLQTEVRKDFP